MKARLLTLILSIIFIVNTLSSCSSYVCDVCKDKDPECKACSVVEPTEAKYFTLNKDVRVVCRLENKSKNLDAALSLMVNAGTALIGQKLTSVEDWSYDEKLRYDYEIIIGNANRPESKKLFDSLSYNDYAYKVISENCVVICGGSDESTLWAVRKFLVDAYGYVDGKSNGELKPLKVGTVFRYNYTYPDLSLMLCGKGIGDYTIVYDGSYADYHSASILKGEISRVCNARLQIVPIDEFEGGDAIYVGIDENGGYDIYDTYPKNCYLVRYSSTDHTSIIIDSDQGIRNGTVIKAFCEEILTALPSKGIYNIELCKGDRFYYTEIPYFNGLKYQSTESTLIDEGVEYQRITYKDNNGAPVIAYAVIADLSLYTAINATPQYSDELYNVRSTTLGAMKSAASAGYSVVAGVNGDFFAIDYDYHPTGLCIKQGKVLQACYTRPWFGITKSGAPVIGSGDDYYYTYEGKLLEAVGGTHIILKDGYLYDIGVGDAFDYTRHPRTAVGITADNKIIILVVDGRQPSLSNGASLTDLAYILSNLGARHALNVDGGGSSTCITYTEKDGYIVRNSPSDGSLRMVYNSIVLVKRDK